MKNFTNFIGLLREHEENNLPKMKQLFFLYVWLNLTRILTVFKENLVKHIRKRTIQTGRLFFSCSLITFGACFGSVTDVFSQEKNTANICHEENYIALRALYLSTDGDNWDNNTGWPDAAFFNDNPTLPANTDFDIWFGIIANTGECIYGLNLKNNGLNGSIPPELGNLSNLQTLDLWENDLVGSIPPELGNLSNLETLNLRLNDLSGSIPAELGNLENLTRLELYSNELEGNIPAELGNASSLEYIHLFSNDLSGSIPPELGNLSELRYLNLGSNDLTGNIPVELTNLPSLDILNLSVNELSGSIPSEFGNSEIRSIDLYYNELTGSIPAEIANLSNLMILKLSSNQLTGSIPPELGSLNSLTRLTLGNNQLTGSIPLEFGSLSSLTVLGLGYNELSGCYSDSLQTLCNQLDYSSNSAISDGNNFNAPWEDFCAMGAGSCTVSVENVYVEAITVFPNPANDFIVFDIENSGTTNVILYDVNGKKVSEQPLSSDRKIMVNQLSKGVYFYQLFQNELLYNGRVLIE